MSGHRETQGPAWPVGFFNNVHLPREDAAISALPAVEELLTEIRALRADFAAMRLQAEYDRLTAAWDRGSL